MQVKKILGKYNLFNEWVAVKLTFGVGSMTCAWAFLIWSLLPLKFPNLTTLVSYVSQSIIQLVLLSVIMVGSAIMNRASELRAEQDHETLMAEFAELKAIHEEEKTIREAESEEITELKEIITLLKSQNGGK
jgi:hypothetical protein